MRDWWSGITRKVQLFSRSAPKSGILARFAGEILQHYVGYLRMHYRYGYSGQHDTFVDGGLA